MGEKTGISWCDHTFNPWIGCQKVSAGCLNCYAARDNNRYQWVGEWGKDYRLTADENWKKPIQWAKQAVKDGVIRRVFCASLADVFDANVNPDWLARLFSLIEETEKIGGLEWLLLTKRPENIFRMHMIETFTNIRIGTTVENQDVLEKRLLDLFKNWHGKNFVSVEPMLSKIDILPWLTECPEDTSEFGFAPDLVVDWVICGCESGENRKPGRPCDLDWVRDLRDQCKQSGTPFFLKQLVIGGKLTKEPYLDGRQWLEFPREA